MRNRGAGAGRRGGKAERKSPSLGLSRDWLCAAQRRTPYIPVSDGMEMVMVMVVIIMMMMMTIACSTNLRFASGLDNFFGGTPCCRRPTHLREPITA